MPGGDGIDVLPDEVLHHILGFLEAQESVRTCVLSRRWRHLWKSATSLRIVADEGKFLGSLEKLCNFVDSLLRHHPGSPLHTCEFRFTTFGKTDESKCSWYKHERLMTIVNPWFWNAVRCQVRVLRLSSYDPTVALYDTVALYNTPVNSRHLTRLEIHGITVYERFLDFSNCPSLEHLEFKNCNFDSDIGTRLQISAPSLVSLLLDDIWGMFPKVESMPSLVKAVVATKFCWEICLQGNCDCEFCDSYYSIGDGTGSNDSVLLKGLSEAKDLALISEPKTFIFKKDLRWCPIFSKLRTFLLIDYWCVPDDFRALVCILEHSPVLEELTLSFSSEKRRYQRERKGSLRPMEGSAALLQHLKIIEIRCHAVDERICKLILFLCAFHIRLSFY